MPGGDDKLLLSDKSLIRSADDVPNSPHHLKGRNGAYKYDPDTKSAQCDLSKIDIRKISYDKYMERDLYERIMSAPNKTKIRIPKSDYDDIANRLEKIEEAKGVGFFLLKEIICPTKGLMIMQNITID